MTLFSSILVPLDGSHTAARSLGCATWLASRMGARLHILSATRHALPAREALARLHIAEAHWPLIELHQVPELPDEAITKTIDAHGVELVVLTARGAASETPGASPPETSKLLGHVTQAVIERSARPVLLLPPDYEEVLPWERALAPVSGGAESDEGLVLAVRLAAALELTVNVVHVAGARAEEQTLGAQTRYCDALHHEYRDRLDELVARATPMLARRDCRRVTSISLESGDVAVELLRRIERDRISVLGVGWNGHFEADRARILKQLIAAVRTPVLLARAAARARFRLDVGEAHF